LLPNIKYTLVFDEKVDREDLEKLKSNALDDQYLEEIKEEEKIGEQVQEEQIMRAHSLNSHDAEEDQPAGACGLEPESISDELAQTEGQQQDDEGADFVPKYLENY
jgi:hypothetical protein